MSFAGGAYLCDVHAVRPLACSLTRVYDSLPQRNTIFCHNFCLNTCTLESLRADVLLHFANVSRLPKRNSGLLDGFGFGINSKSTQSHKIPLMLVVPRTIPYISIYLYLFVATVASIAVVVRFICIRVRMNVARACVLCVCVCERIVMQDTTHSIPNQK